MHFKKTEQKFFVNNFCLSELHTFKFLTQKEITITQISATSPSPNFHWGKSYVKKLGVYFLAICINFPCKIKKFDLEVVRMGILKTGFCFQGKH